MKKLFSQFIVAVTLPVYTLVSATSSYANLPDYGKLVRITGPNTLNVRSGSSYYPAEKNSIFRPNQHELSVSGDNETWGQLDFFNSADQHMELSVQAGAKNSTLTLYYLPCKVLNGNSFILEWLNENIGERGCERGIRIRPGEAISSQLPLIQNLYAQDWLKQRRGRGRESYCTVLSDSGNGWISLNTSRNPCNQAMEACSSSGESGCTPVTLDSWFTREENLTAIVGCDNDQTFSDTTSGAKMKELINQVWQESQAANAKYCALHVVNELEQVVEPEPTDDEKIKVEVNTIDGKNFMKIISGDVKVRSAKNPGGKPVKEGQTYSYGGVDEEDPIGTFDTSVKSLDLLIFDGSQVTASKANSSNALVSVNEVDVFMLPDDEVTIDITVKVPQDFTPRYTSSNASQIPLDFFLLQDLSGSFKDDLNVLNSLVSDLVSRLTSLQPNTRFGAASFVDIGVYGYRTHLPLTNSEEAFQTTLNSFSTNTSDGNDDIPESQLTALVEMVRNYGNIGFRDNAKRVAVIATDAPYNEGGDYPSMAQVRRALWEKDIIPIFTVTSEQIGTYQDVVDYSDGDGVGFGLVVKLEPDSSNLIEAITGGLEKLERTISVSPTDDQYSYIKSISQSTFENISAGDEFTYTVTLGSDGSGSDDTITLRTRGYGQIGFGDTVINIKVP